MTYLNNQVYNFEIGKIVLLYKWSTVFLFIENYETSEDVAELNMVPYVLPTKHRIQMCFSQKRKFVIRSMYNLANNYFPFQTSTQSVITKPWTQLNGHEFWTNFPPSKGLPSHLTKGCCPQMVGFDKH